MPKEWPFLPFVKLVEAKFGLPAVEALSPALLSIPEKLRFCTYHSRHALSLMTDHRPQSSDHVAQFAAAMQLMNQSNEGERLFMEALFGAKVHVLGFAQCLHSTSDYLAKTVYYGLNLHPRFNLTDTQIGLKKIRDKMETVSELAGVHAAIKGYLASPEFSYLAAFVNTEKHHEIISTSLSLSVSAGAMASAGIKLAQFNYCGTSFPQKWASEFFEHDLEAILNSTAEIGCAMMDYLQSL